MHGDLEGQIRPDIRCSLRNLSSSSCSLTFSGYTLQSFNIVLGINSMAWSHLDQFGSFLNTALLKTRSLKSLYSSGMFPPTFSILSLWLRILNSSLLYASSSRLTNNTFSPSSMAFSSMSSSSISSSSFGT